MNAVMRAAMNRSKLRAGMCALLLAAGCDEGMKVIYRERIALLPDASGLLEKEIRSDAEGKPFLALLETRNGATRDLAVLRMEGYPDVKFRSGLGGDTVLLYHGVSRFQKDLEGTRLGAAGFPVRAVLLDDARWFATGTEEGNAIFYAPAKWKAYLDMNRGK